MKLNTVFKLFGKVFFLFGFVSLLNVHAQNSEGLEIGKDDTLIIQSPEGGYDLYIRAKPRIKSVLLTETTKDPGLKLDNYAYRNPSYNPVNGDEKRLLNGELLSSEKKLYSLIDSTTEKDTPLGEAYHIWIPYVIVYGYNWSRNGEIEVKDGTFFNIRTFEKPYGDYSGEFKDNPFVLRVTQKEAAVKDKKPDYVKDAVEAFTSLAEASYGKLIYASDPEELISSIENLIRKKNSDKADFLFVLDATESMKDDIAVIRKRLMPVLKKELEPYSSYRIGLILYKDYKDDFLVREACVFTDNFKKFEKALNAVQVFGGRDIPEAVYEGLFLGLRQSWRAKENDVDKKLILIGDGPPHKRPRGKVKKDEVYKLAEEKSVSVYPILLPHGYSY